MNRHLAHLLATALLAAVISACSHHNAPATASEEPAPRPIGAWQPAQVSKSVIELPASDATDTVTLTNYPAWRIVQAIVTEQGKVVTLTPTDYDRLPADQLSQLTTRWMRLSVSQAEPQKLVIHCLANESSEPRTVSIGMAAGNAHLTLKLTQQGEKKQAHPQNIIFE